MPVGQEGSVAVKEAEEAEEEVEEMLMLVVRDDQHTIQS